MEITLTKDITIAGVKHDKGEKIEVTEAQAVLLSDCYGGKKRAAKNKAGNE
tara:strand:- start:408 stop:560 length:153 start_codon:yes stop_codon:yes gene_type:complete